MAFPVPSHLPRRDHARDVTSTILSRLDETPAQALSAAVASTWLAELDESILRTKTRIHECVQSQLAAFHEQLNAAKSVQARVETLRIEVERVDAALSQPQKGLVPSLINGLKQHSELAQAFSDAEATFRALEHLQHCRTALHSLSSLIDAGKLPDAVAVCKELQTWLDEAPEPLPRASVMADLRLKCRTKKDHAEELLLEAYSRSVVVSAHSVIIRPFVQVRNSNEVISFKAILSSLTPASLTDHLAMLRRDFVAHLVDRLLRQPMLLTVAASSGDGDTQERKLTLVSSQPDAEQLTDRLHNLSSALEFLSDNLFLHIPSPHRETFPKLLCKPVTTALLNHLIVPSIPSSVAGLPNFLDLAKGAVEFEERIVVQRLGSSPEDTPIKDWVDGVSGHYERKRRVDIIAEARVIILKNDGYPANSFRVECQPDPQSRVPLPPSEENGTENDAWGFDDASGTKVGESGWGFEDDASAAVEESKQADQDPADAWGWNENEEVAKEDDEASWDPWNEHNDSWSNMAQAAIPATRLEKTALKGKKKQTNGHKSEPSESLPSTSLKGASKSTGVPMPLPKETYLVSTRTTEIMDLVWRVLREYKQLSSSALFQSHFSSRQSPGTLLSQVALSPLDLYRALYLASPAGMSSSPGQVLRFANDCIYLSDVVGRITTADPELLVLEDRLQQCQTALRFMGDCCYEEFVQKQKQLINDILDRANRFTSTTDQDRFDECENALHQVLKHVRAVAPDIKAVLPKGKYFDTVGSIVDAAVSRAMSDVLALPDITEVESHQLGELCRILNALEALFVEDHDQPSFVVAYVPSWLKFSYLAELLEASIADISYLFEEGALVDFEIDELVRLVRALFADTPLRTTTINKLMHGHPVHE